MYFFISAFSLSPVNYCQVGSAISPNGLGLSEDGMMSMALMDKVISIDKEKMQVVVQCGAQLLEHGFIHSFFQNHISPTIIPKTSRSQCKRDAECSSLWMRSSPMVSPFRCVELTINIQWKSLCSNPEVFSLLHCLNAELCFYS